MYLSYLLCELAGDRERRTLALMYVNAGVGRLLGAGLFVCGLLIGCGVDPGQRQAALTAPAILNVVAHEDDDLLFLSPDLLHDIQASRSVTTIFITAGDANRGTDYWHRREAGIKAAYAKMAGVADAWTERDAGIAAHPIPVFALDGTAISVAFLRLPDGSGDGEGFSNNGYESLQKLWTGRISTIRVLDGTSSYAKADLIGTLVSLMSSFQPTQIRTQDYLGRYGDGDHSDHYSVGYLTQAAEQQYATAHSFVGYLGQFSALRPINLFPADLASKQSVFVSYAQYDGTVCRNVSDCNGSSYGQWLARQYTLPSSPGGNREPIANA
jgi:LmbE family N-acetylglucosaminyl deacetylase